jgi:hypothetical protein
MYSGALIEIHLIIYLNDLKLLKIQMMKNKEEILYNTIRDKINTRFDVIDGRNSLKLFEKKKKLKI